tara:strand:+ start:8854 stop:10515 length:1662 start_codon:yes stop_codon:yes gene_type:complete
MKYFIQKALTDWAYKVNDGCPDPQNRTHIQILETVLRQYGCTEEFISEYIPRVHQAHKLYEDDIVKNKKSGNTYVVKTHNKNTQTLIKKDASAADIAKVKNGDSSEGDSTKSISKQLKKDEFVKSTLEWMKENLSKGRESGKAGEFAFQTQEEAKQMMDFYDRKEAYEKENPGKMLMTPKIYEVDDNDIDTVIRELEEHGKAIGKGKGYLIKKIDGKGAPGAALQTVERRRSLIKDYLETGGISIITGKRISFAESQLDHAVSLTNGGKDEPDNWHWMEARFNQQKGELEDDEMRVKIQKVIDQDPDEFSLERKKEEIKNIKKQGFVKLFAKKFKEGDDAGLTERSLNDYTTEELNYIAKGMNEGLELKGNDQVKRSAQKTDTNPDTPTSGSPINRDDDIQPKPNKREFDKSPILKKLRAGEELSDSEKDEYNLMRKSWGVKWDRKTNKPTGEPEGENELELVDYKGKKYPKGWVDADKKFSSGRSSGGRPLSKEALMANIIDGFKRVEKPLLTEREVKKIDADVDALAKELQKKEGEVKATKAKIKAKKKAK